MKTIDELLPKKYQGATKGEWSKDDNDLVWSLRKGEYIGKALGLEDDADIDLPLAEVEANARLFADSKENAALASLLPAAVKALERAFKSLNLAEGPQAAKAYTEQSSPPYKKDKEFTTWVEMREALAEAQNTLARISEATKAVEGKR